MEKDFDKWNEKKKDIDDIVSKIYFNQWDIWWCSLWRNIKSESFGKWENFRRPILVLKKLSSDSCIAIPLSTKIKTWTWFTQYDLHGTKYTALLYQIRMIHKNRFWKKVGQLDEADFENIKKSLADLLELSF